MVNTSCPTTGMFCPYLERLDALAMHASVLQQEESPGRANTGKEIEKVITELAPDQDNKGCRDGYCVAIGEMLTTYVVATAIRRLNDRSSPPTKLS